jgi:AraC family transcriptional regulator of adaptative response / DNA-3-methyladenine glycosylase II
VRVAYRPPLAWDALLAFLAARAIPGVERVEGGAYVRAARLAGGAAVIEVRLGRDGRSLEVEIAPLSAARAREAAARVREMFDLGADPEVIAAALGPDPLLGPAVRARPGLRVPGGWDRFEVLVRAVAGQQVSVAAAAQVLGRIAARAGPALSAELHHGFTSLFPAPAELAALEPAELPMPRARGAALVALAASVAGGALRLERGPTLEATLARLLGRPGVGPWTAQLVAMRALHEPDAFPAGDLGIRRALGAGGAPLPEAEALARAEAWRPWRAYAAQHLWAMDAAARRPREARAR